MLKSRQWDGLTSEKNAC
uniref:Uncharacterized protein n=1 Tax=Rhizophora mucronata TaxID=61149 RepID=A0A2P2QYH3_RHIMU